MFSTRRVRFSWTAPFSTLSTGDGTFVSTTGWMTAAEAAKVRVHGMAGCGAASRAAGGRDGGEPLYVEGCGVKECAEVADALATASEEAASILNNWMQYWRTCAGPRGCTGNGHAMYREAWNEAIDRVNSASRALVDAGCGPAIVLK